eukprot:Tbor_TRINITY_DN5308_c0_g1::TRINITY_DN5308_c0_g1_i1::g.4109::m.4109/K05349/bglX; beta-glucosidase
MDDIFEISSKFGSKIPILYGIDSVHGANYVYNATIFPHNIGIGATFNTDLAYVVGRVTALETRYAGIPWVFSPVLGVVTQPAWAGVYETFGEDTTVVTALGKYMIGGLQSKSHQMESEWRYTVAACGKHFVGNSDVRTGRYRTPAYMPYSMLYEKFLPPFQSAINPELYNSVLSIMESYGELNGRPVVSSELLLNFVLRKEFNFTGMLVTEYNEVFNLATFHMSTKNYTTAVLDSINVTSIDMAMIGMQDEFPYFNDIIREYYKRGDIVSQRLRETGYRLMQLKRQLSLVSPVEGNNTAHINPVPKNVKGCVFACPSHREEAFKAAIESITLLKNEGNILPLLTPIKKVAVIGQGCNSIPLMSGGRTVKLEGSSDKDDFPYGSTIYEEMKSIMTSSTVEYAYGCNVTEKSVCGEDHLQRAVNISSWSDVVLLCLGESHYAGHLGDIDDMVLPGEQLDMARKVIKAQPNNKVIVLLVEGRPRILMDIPDLVPAVVHLYLPGPAGGKAATHILLGNYNPSGRLPITYPSSLSNAPIQYDRKWSANAFNDYQVQWEFGHGLSYTQIEVNSIDVQMDEGMYIVTVSLSSYGTVFMDTFYTVMIYASQAYRSITPSVRKLVAFRKVYLITGVKDLSEVFYISPDAFSYFDEYLCQITENSRVILSCGNMSAEVVPDSSQYVTCSLWGQQVLKNTEFNVIIPTPKPGNWKPEASASTYFISSVVCFGAGIVGTVIFITWMRKKGETEEGLLLEPTSV